jgi:prolyl oligopeptidase
VAFHPEEYTTEQVFYTGKDGTKIPLFLTYKKGLQKNGAHPCLLYGYGGFNISLNPSFSVYRLAFIEKGGIYAQATLRGGGEYGEEWHQAGTRLNKQNVFDDFIAAAEYLIKEQYTSKDKLAVNGGSNGGLLVGAVVNQRPDLFKAAVPQVGVMDMLRYHTFTIGWNWASDYGTSEDSREMFDYLYAYSPLHNIKNDGTPYPAILVTTADHDDRVVPAHSFKYAATLQAAPTGEAPKLIRIETKAGHGSGKPIGKVIDEYADIYAFLMYNLDMSF